MLRLWTQMVVLSLGLTACLCAAETTKIAYDLSPGEAALRLQEFSAASGRDILFASETVRGVSTNAVHGSFTPVEALERMLQGTNLEAWQDGKSETLVIRRRPTPRAEADASSPNPAHKPTTMSLSSPTKPGILARLGGAVALLLAPSINAATDGATGTITGRIFNPATGEYVRNAEVRLAGSGLTAVSADAGAYSIGPVPAGEATLTVTYTGYRTASATVAVAAGATIKQDFDLVSTADVGKSANEITKLSSFVVSSVREGAAKAIMDQRNSMNVTNTISSDSFGDNPDGNLGEFLKNVPGVELEVVYGDVRTVRLGGLPSEYTSVMIDGMALASVDASNISSGATRAFTMEMASLNSVDSIEVSKTISADVDANAPAGTINLRTKRAFDRAGRRFSWQANVTGHSEHMTLGKSYGADDANESRKVYPGGVLEYSDIFLNKRLGIVLNVSEANSYTEALITTTGYSAAPTAADPRPAVVSSLAFLSVPRYNKRFATTLTADYKINEQLNVGLGVVYNYADLWNPQRTLTFNAGTRTSVVGNDPLVSFTSASNGSVNANPALIAKLGETITLMPRFEFKRGALNVEGKFAYSDSTSQYDPYAHRHTIRDLSSGAVASNITFRAQRSSADSNDWHITQTAGNDLSSGKNFSTPAITVNDGRFARTTFYSGEINATLKTGRSIPIVWKSGIKSRLQAQKLEDDQLAKRYDYIGGPTTGGYADFQSPWPHSVAMIDGSVASLSGGNVFYPNLHAIADLYQSNPGAFRQNWGTNADNFYQSYVARRRRLYERIDSGYLMGTGKLRNITLRAGLRWEATHTETSEADARKPAEVRAAGFPVAASGIATTIPGIQYQFLSRPRVKHEGSYDNFFPSASLKYNLMPNLDLLLGYSATIRRAPYASVSGVWTINDTNRTVTLPNPTLKPEMSDNYSARLAYYFEPVGQLSATVSERKVDKLFITDTLTAAEYGYTGNDELSTYDFITTSNATDRVRIRSMEIEYSQNLARFGPWFKPFVARAAYTRLYAEVPRANLTPHLASGGLNYTYRRLNLYGNWTWAANYNTNVAGTNYRRHRSNLDVGGGFRLSNNYSLSLSVRNVLNTPFINMQTLATGPTVIQRHEIVGSVWTMAIKGAY